MENIPRIHDVWASFKRFKNLWKIDSANQSSSTTALSSRQCLTTLCVGEKGNAEKCEVNWSFLGLGSEKKWYGTYSDKPDGVWDKTAEDMMLELAETIHPMFRASSVLERV